jgi:putative transposase
LERLFAGPEVSRPAPPPDTLRLAFRRQVQRSQRRTDGTGAVESLRFEVPSRFRHLPELTLRYALWERSTVTLIDPTSAQPLARLLPQGKQKNASGQRRRHEPLAPGAPLDPRPDPNPIPALLSQWLADFAATGRPPAYLPKDELPDEENPS